MRRVLLATAAAAVIGLSASGAQADFWEGFIIPDHFIAANVNYGDVEGNLKVSEDLTAGTHGTVTVGNIGALTTNESIERNVGGLNVIPVLDGTTDMFGTLNVNKGDVDGDLTVYGELSVQNDAAISVSNIGAATTNKSTNSYTLDLPF